MVATGLFGLVCAGLYGGVAFTFRCDEISREHARATQILVQNMETIRLCKWSQSDPATNFIPASLTAYFDPGATNGLAYQVQFTITNPPNLGAAYSNDLRMLTAKATWTSGGIQRSRSMSTYIARPGLLWYAP